MIPFLFFSIKRAWQGFWRNALMSLAATATMVLMLLLLAGFWIIQTGLLAGLEFTEQKVEVIAYLQPNATDGQIETLQAELMTMPEVESITYVTRDEALDRFRDSMEAQGREDLTQYLDSNPLYASLEVKLVDPSAVARGRRSPASRPNGPQRHQHRGPRRSGADRHEHPAHRRHGGPHRGRASSCLFIIVNTIRLAVFARAEEIEIMRLVGASDAFIRWPFVFEGAFVGFLGAAITLGVLAAAADPLSGFMVEFFRVLPLAGRLDDPRPRHAGHGRRRRTGHPRFVGLGPDVPHPLGAGGRTFVPGASRRKPLYAVGPLQPGHHSRHARTSHAVP